MAAKKTARPRTPRTRTRVEYVDRVRYRDRAKKKRAPRPKPTDRQIASGATSALLLGVPLGVAASAMGLGLDAAVAKKGGFAPPVIGWRGLIGLLLFLGGAVGRSPVVLTAGLMLFGTSLPAATNALARAFGAPLEGFSLPGIAGDAGALPYKPEVETGQGGLPALLRRAAAEALQPRPSREEIQAEIRRGVAQALAERQEEVAGDEDLETVIEEEVGEAIADLAHSS